jgi:hypothetical protein
MLCVSFCLHVQHYVGLDRQHKKTYIQVHYAIVWKERLKERSASSKKEKCFFFVFFLFQICQSYKLMSL